MPFKRYATSNTFPAQPSGYLISKPPTEIVATFINEVDGSRLVDALIVISESHTPTVARPEPNGIPAPELILMVVAARAAEDIRPKNKKNSRKGLLSNRFKPTPPPLKNLRSRNPKFPLMNCRVKKLPLCHLSK